jgi:hypothetical protein
VPPVAYGSNTGGGPTADGVYGVPGTGVVANGDTAAGAGVKGAGVADGTAYGEVTVGAGLTVPNVGGGATPVVGYGLAGAGVVICTG